MTYRAGIAPGMKALGMDPGPPQFTCDGCGIVYRVNLSRRIAPPAWMLKDHPSPPKWVAIPNLGGFTHSHYCSVCRGAQVK